MATILDGKQVAESLYKKLVLDLSLLPAVPQIVLLIAGEDPASETYVASKSKRCQDLGIRSRILRLPATVSQKQLITEIQALNADPEVHGILVQLPLPASVDRYAVLESISPKKDVDGLHPHNAGLLLQGKADLVPCTPAGIIEILKFYKIPIEGKRAVVVGRSEIVGKPMGLLLLQENATVTFCHSRTANLSSVTREADILVAALGKREAITADFVKQGAVVIDVGIHRLATPGADGKKLTGDVKFSEVEKRASAITPVPGGVGPMTIGMLMRNLIVASRSRSA